MGITEIREIDQRVNRLQGKGTEEVSVFHGRDLFGYCAAKLASGIISYEQVGLEYPVNEIISFPIEEPILMNGKVKGIFEIGDPNYGNLWTNIPLTMFNEAGFDYGETLNLVVWHQGEIVLMKKFFSTNPLVTLPKGNPSSITMS